MCIFFTLDMGTEGRLDTFVSATGKWWGTDSAKKEQTDIDVVGLNAFRKEAVLGMNLIEKTGLLSGGYKVVQFLLFSKSGFSDRVVEHAVVVIGLSGMYRMG